MSEPRDVRKKISEYLEAIFLSTRDLTEINPGITDEVVKDFSTYFIPTLVYLYYSTNKSSPFLDFCYTTLKERKYPEIRSLFEQQYEYFQNLVATENFLKRELSFKDESTNDVAVLGDVHPNDTTKFRIGDHQVYKRILSYESLINSISTEFKEYEKFFPNNIFEEGVVKRDYIDYSGNYNSASEIGEYFFNLGFILPLLSLLKVVDLNFENILVNKSYPYFFDMECMFLPESGLFEDYDVVSTGIVPIESEFGDTSGFSGGYEPVASLLMPILDIRGGEPFIKWKGISKYKSMNRLFLNDELINPKEYVDNLLDGFREGKDFIVANKHRLLDIIKSYDRISARLLLRPTRVYRYITIKSLYPNNIVKDRKAFIRSELLKYPILPKLKNKSNMEKIIEIETESIYSCIIPAFYFDIYNGEIYDYFHNFCGYLNMRPIEDVNYRINNALITLNADLSMLKKTLL